MRIGVVVVAHAATDLQALAERCRAATTELPHWYVAAFAPEPQQRAGLARFVLEQPATLWLHAAPVAVASAQNEAILASAADGSDVTILLEPEVEFAPGGLDRFAAFVLQQEAAGIVLAGLAERAGSTAGCVAIGPAAYNWLGALDENIATAELVLTDYLLRAAAASIPVAVDPTPLLRAAPREAEASATTSVQRYFATKWGGPPGATTEARPFGSLSSRIDWSARRAPYGAAHDLPRPPPARPEMFVSRPLASETTPLERISPGPAQQAVLRASIRAVYQAMLEREPEEAAYDWYVERLASGATTLTELCGIVRGSDEHRMLAAAREPTREPS